MALIWQNPMSGLADETAITVQNSTSAGGNALTAVLPGTGGSIVQDVIASGALQGSWWRFIQTGTDQCQARVDLGVAGDGGRVVATFEFAIDQLPGSASPIVRAYQSYGPGPTPTAAFTGGTGAWDAATITGAGRFYVRDSVAATNSPSSTPNIVVATPYTGTWVYDPTAQTGTLNVYPRGSSSPLLTVAYSMPAAHSLGSFMLGIMASAATGMTLRMRNVSFYSDGNPRRPDIVVAAPATALGANMPDYRTAPAAAATISGMTFTATSSTNITDITATVVAKPTAANTPTLSITKGGVGTTSATATVGGSFPTIGRYVIAVAAANSTGTGAPALVTIDTTPADGDRTILTAFEGTQWSTLGTETDPKVALNDRVAATGVISPAGPGSWDEWIQAGPLNDKGVSFTIGGGIDGSGSLTCRVETYKADKTTKIFTTGGSGNPADLDFSAGTNASPLLITTALTPAALAAIPPGGRDRSGTWWHLIWTLA